MMTSAAAGGFCSARNEEELDAERMAARSTKADDAVRRRLRWFSLLPVSFVLTFSLAFAFCGAHGQTVGDGSDAVIGKNDTRVVLDLIGRSLKNSADAKVTDLRRSKGSIVCGSVNVKNKEGLYLGERGFVVDLADKSFGRVPEGAEILSPLDDHFEEKERVRALYFAMCLD